MQLRNKSIILTFTQELVDSKLKAGEQEIELSEFEQLNNVEIIKESIDKS
jgi:DNA repair protein RecN (Recombination protein N)